MKRNSKLGLMTGKCLRVFALSVAFAYASVSNCHAEFDLTFQYAPSVSFTTEQLELLDEAFAKAEQIWEAAILGHQGTENNVVFPLTVSQGTTGLASAGPDNWTLVGDYFMATSGSIFVNASQILPMATGFGDVAPGTNFLDDVMAHEIGHALGFGTMWNLNDAYENNSGQFTGEFAVAAYKNEFDADATFVPVELAGSGGSANSHWNQLFRSSPQEGNPDDPWSLSPLTGILDSRGRDFAQDLMSPAVDPDYGEPFLSNTTVQAFRDIGYLVVDQFPIPGDLNEDGLVNIADIDFLSQVTQGGTADLFFDLDENGTVDASDRAPWYDVAMTTPGDSDFDGRFDSADLITVFRKGIYEDDITGNAKWSDGDWNGDGDFDTGDLTYAFSFGGYVAEGRAQAVPEPVSLVGLFSLLLFRRLISTGRAGRVVRVA